MNIGWVTLSIFSAFFAAAINHTDKFLMGKVSGEQENAGGVGALVIISSLMGFLVAFLIFLFYPSVISYKSYLPIIINGGIYIAWLIPYFIAINEDEASVVAPLFQISPVISIFLGYFFLGEILSLGQFLGALLVLLGSIALSIEFASGKIPRLKIKILLLMALSSTLIALNGVLFKVFALETDFWTTSFWEYVGFGLTGVAVFAFVPQYRKQFLDVLEKNSKLIWGVNFGNEVMAMIAKILLNYASILGVVAAVFFIAEGFQPFFVLTIGVGLTVLFPNISKENIEKRFLAQKVISILVMFAGTYVLYNF